MSTAILGIYHRPFKYDKLTLAVIDNEGSIVYRLHHHVSVATQETECTPEQIIDHIGDFGRFLADTFNRCTAPRPERRGNDALKRFWGKQKTGFTNDESIDAPLTRDERQASDQADGEWNNYGVPE